MRITRRVFIESTAAILISSGAGLAASDPLTDFNNAANAIRDQLAKADAEDQRKRNENAAARQGGAIGPVETRDDLAAAKNLDMTVADQESARWARSTVSPDVSVGFLELAKIYPWLITNVQAATAIVFVAVEEPNHAAFRGSGVLIDRLRIAITCHETSGPIINRARFGVGRDIPILSLQMSPITSPERDLDLAFAIIGPESKAQTHLRIPAFAALTSDVLLAGFVSDSRAVWLHATKGLVGLSWEHYSAKGRDGQLLPWICKTTIKGISFPGMSGGGAWDAAGNLVGIIHSASLAGARETAAITPIDLVLDMGEMDRQGAVYQSEPPAICHARNVTFRP